MTLATVSQVEALVGDLNGDDEDRAVVFLGMAQALVEGIVGRSVEPGPRTDTLHPAFYRDALLLPGWPLDPEATVTVTVDGDVLDATGWRVDHETGTLTRLADTLPAAFDAVPVVVDYTVAAVGELATLCAFAAARAMRARADRAARPALLAGLRQLTIGRWSATADGGPEADPIAALQLTDAERAIARRWKDRRP